MTSLCVKGLTEKLKLKPEVAVFADEIFQDYLPKEHPERVFPKNRKRRNEDGKILKDFRKELPEGQEGERDGLVRPDKVDRDLNESCLERVYDMNIDLTVVLVVTYIAVLYAYCDTRGILVQDVVDWVIRGDLPYMVVYKDLELPKVFQSLFKPLNIPSSSWLRKKLAKGKIDVGSGFRTYFPFIYNLCCTMCSKLSLPASVSQLVYKLYQTSQCTSDLHSKLLPVLAKQETIVAAFILSTLKLLYGLNDTTYIIDLSKSSKRKVKHEIILTQSSLSQTEKFLETLPSLTELFLIWEGQASALNYYHKSLSIRDLDQLLEFAVKNLDFKVDNDLEFQEFKGEKTVKIHKSENFVKKNRELARACNKYLKTGEMRTPAQEFWVQKKSCDEKKFPFDFVFALNSVCSICGKLSTGQVYFICDRIDRELCKKNEVN